MHIVWTILIGFIIGALARALKPGNDPLGFFMTALIGIGGAFLAKFVGIALGWYGRYDRAGLLASIGGAVVLLVLYETVMRKRAVKAED